MENQSFDVTLKVVARIYNDLPTKFGIPRQSGLVNGLISTVVFEPEFRNADALKGLEFYSHLWLIWGFSANREMDYSPTVRPPRLGGNVRLGVFATRSPHRPNPLGLSSVRIVEVKPTKEKGVVIVVAGADLMNGTPIYDIKPYLPAVDSHADAVDDFDRYNPDVLLDVVVAEGVRLPFSEAEKVVLKELLSRDPRPAYHQDALRIYGMPYAGKDVLFKVEGRRLTVVEIK